MHVHTETTAISERNMSDAMNHSRCFRATPQGFEQTQKGSDDPVAVHSNEICYNITWTDD